MLERRVLVALLADRRRAVGLSRAGRRDPRGRAVPARPRHPAAVPQPGRPERPDRARSGWKSAVRDVTALGGTVVITIVTLGAAGFLLLSGKRGAAAVRARRDRRVPSLLSFAIKAGIERPRPDLFPHGAPVYTASFPSGHATGAAATYLTLGALLARFQRAAPAQDLPADAGRAPHAADRPVAALSRRPLAVGRAGRLDPGRLLGAALLAGRPPAAAPRQGGDRARRSRTRLAQAATATRDRADPAPARICGSNASAGGSSAWQIEPRQPRPVATAVARCRRLAPRARRKPPSAVANSRR